MHHIRNGQWLKFKPAAPIQGAHTLADGHVVGIFNKGGVDGLGQAHEDQIMVVDPQGRNLPTIDDGQIKNVSVKPTDVLATLAAVENAEDIPAARRATMRDGFQPGQAGKKPLAKAEVKADKK